MTATIAGFCRKRACTNLIPATLASEQVCLDHFLDEAFHRTNETMQKFHEGVPLGPLSLEQVLSDALTVVSYLEEGEPETAPQSRERMLELLLSLANLHEYAAHHSFPSGAAS